MANNNNNNTKKQNKKLQKYMDKNINIDLLTDKENKPVEEVDKTTFVPSVIGSFLGSALLGVVTGVLFSIFGLFSPILVGFIVGLCFTALGAVISYKTSIKTKNYDDEVRANSVMFTERTLQLMLPLLDFPKSIQAIGDNGLLSDVKFLDENGAMLNSATLYKKVPYIFFDPITKQSMISIRHEDLKACEGNEKGKNLMAIIKLLGIEKDIKDYFNIDQRAEETYTYDLTTEQTKILLNIIKSKMDKIDLNSMSDGPVKKRCKAFTIFINNIIEGQKNQELEDSIQKYNEQLKKLDNGSPSNDDIQKSKDACQKICDICDEYIEYIDKKIAKSKKQKENTNEAKKCREKIEKAKKTFQPQLQLYQDILDNDKINDINKKKILKNIREKVSQYLNSSSSIEEEEIVPKKNKNETSNLTLKENRNKTSTEGKKNNSIEEEEIVVEEEEDKKSKEKKDKDDEKNKFLNLKGNKNKKPKRSLANRNWNRNRDRT